MIRNELQLVEWLRSQQVGSEAVGLGIGDDMAVVRAGAELLLLSSDILLDGVHFDSARHEPDLIGRKAVACSLSDCAAMAVKPLAATISVALPRGAFGTATARGECYIKSLFRGMQSMAEEFELAIVGGDTGCWSNPLAIDVSVAARPFEGTDPVARRGARVGDVLYVTGPLGGSMLGRHLTFTPRVREAKLVADAAGAGLHAMIDISDGLALDLWRMCQASGVGALLDESELQRAVSQDAVRLAEGGGGDGRTALDHALGDGEDFELLMAISAGTARECGVDLTRIGVVSEGGLGIRRANGRVAQLEPGGFVHGLP